MIPVLFSSDVAPYPGKKPYSMPHYEYLLRSTDSENVKSRKYWNDVFKRCRLPDEVKDEIAARFKDKRLEQHIGALFELFIFEFLTGAGYEVYRQQPLPGGNPDYRVKARNGMEFFLEATCSLGDASRSKPDEQVGQLFDSLSSIESSEFRVCASLVGEIGSGVRKGDSKRLRCAIEKWLADLDYDELLSRQLGRTTINLGDEHIEKSFKVGGAVIRIHPIAISPPMSSHDNGLVMVEFFGSVGLIVTDEYISRKLNEKKKQVSRAELPAVIAINVLAWSLDEGDILKALFRGVNDSTALGEETTDEIRGSRALRGIWALDGQEPNKKISAVLFFYNVGHKARPLKKPIMVFNPFVPDAGIPIDLPCVDYFKPTPDGLRLLPIGDRKGAQEDDKWEETWPLGWKE